MPKDAIEVRFGSAQVEFLSIWLRGRAYRPSEDYWDGNWLLVTVDIHAGKFSGQVPGILRAEELVRLNNQLRTFYESLTGVVTYETVEEWLTFRVEADKLGNILISGRVNDEVGDPHNSLEFAIKTDQTFLAAALQQLKQIVKAFPVIGRP